MNTLKIAVASCAKFAEDGKQLVWKQIEDEKPDALLLAGDNVYLAKPEPTKRSALVAALNARYDELFTKVPAFTHLLADLAARGRPVIPIYDDHDFLGDNRCGAEPRFKTGGLDSVRRAARDTFLKRWQEHIGPLEVRPQGGLYRLVKLGLVDVIVLDCRYHRVPLTDEVATHPNAFLGSRQFDWLATTHDASTAPYKLVLSSTTAHNFSEEADVESGRAESWAQYTEAYKHLTRLLAGRPGTLVVSGDIHKNVLSGEDGLVEVVTSGVARNGAQDSTRKLRNWAMLTFDEDALHIELRRNSQVGDDLMPLVPRLRDVALTDWRLNPKDVVDLPD